MPALNALAAILAYALVVTLVGACLAALGLLFSAIMPTRQQVCRTFLTPAAFRLGTLHALGLVVLLALSSSRPLLGLLAVAWLIFFLVCALLGLSSWVGQIGFRLWPEAGPARRALGSGMVLSWACAVPYVGWLLALGLLSTAYGAGMMGWLRRSPQPSQESPREDRNGFP